MRDPGAGEDQSTHALSELNADDRICGASHSTRPRTRHITRIGNRARKFESGIESRANQAAAPAPSEGA